MGDTPAPKARHATIETTERSTNLVDQTGVDCF